MKSSNNKNVSLACSLCAFCVLVLVTQFLFPKDTHKNINDYLKTYEQLVIQVEKTPTADVESYIALSKKSTEYSLFAKQLQSNKNWTEADNVRMEKLTQRYNEAVHRFFLSNSSSSILK
ncbi:MAG: hypothetical protein K6F69_02040 [Treponema sp.]|nr:hypothetical protein [Treponema sp.]